MTPTPLASLEAGTPLEGVFAVRRKERRLSRQGRPFLALTLADATGAVPAMVFDEADFFGAQFAEGDRVRVSGRVTERDGRTSVIVSHLRPAPDEAEAFAASIATGNRPSRSICTSAAGRSATSNTPCTSSPLRRRAL